MSQQDKNGKRVLDKHIESHKTKYHTNFEEGNTKLIKKNNVWFKCEFENPTGSVKDRAVASQVSHLHSLGYKSTVISSSGNAAISAANYCLQAKIKLSVFLSPHIRRSKHQTLEKLGCVLYTSTTPVKDAFIFAKEEKAYNLRQSKDDSAVLGYMTIAFELLGQIQDADAIFLPVSSGTTLVGIARGYEKMHKIYPAFHIVQTQAVHPVSVLFDKTSKKQERSIADAIVAKYTPRQEEIVSIINTSKGSGWIVSDKEIINATKKLHSFGLYCSYEGGATYAAYIKAKKKGYIYEKPVCVLTGKYYA